MKIYEQITFDFNEASAPKDAQPAVGVRIKALKQPLLIAQEPAVPEAPAAVIPEETPSVPELPAEETTETIEAIYEPEEQGEPLPEPVIEPAPTPVVESDPISPLQEVITPSQPALVPPPVERVIAASPVVRKSGRGRKSLKEMEASVDLINVPSDEVLFQRQYYAIGEVADMFGVNQSLLRFWENEFDILQPRKNRKGDRHFRPVDIKNLELIYDLLRRRKLTIEGAKDFLKQNKMAKERFEMIQSLQNIRGFLLEIKAKL
ncbi:MAG: MerR family transcriptional regulator [Chitinophagaceae bacterium]